MFQVNWTKVYEAMSVTLAHREFLVIINNYIKISSAKKNERRPKELAHKPWINKIILEQANKKKAMYKKTKQQKSYGMS